MKRTHQIETRFGIVKIEEAPEGHLVITTPNKLNAMHVSVFLNTIWSDCDLAVCVNGTWLKDAFAAGQHREPGNLED